MNLARNPPVCRNRSPSAPPPIREDVVCERCGVYGAYAWEGATLCLQCTIEQGSCCPEFEGDSRPTVSETQPAKFDCS